jgi:shikimate kinase
MGAGKTTVGRALAKRLRWQFCDLDDLIEQRERQSVAQIFASIGEAGFRQAESAALRTLLQESPAAGDLVLALGGGAFVQEQNRLLLEHAGVITVLLEAPLEELRRRCQSEHKVRPLAQQQERFAELFAARQSGYDRAQLRVQTLNKPVEQIAAEIETLLQRNLEVPK